MCICIYDAGLPHAPTEWYPPPPTPPPAAPCGVGPVVAPLLAEALVGLDWNTQHV